jgi:hypothetical protein
MFGVVLVRVGLKAASNQRGRRPCLDVLPLISVLILSDLGAHVSDHGGLKTRVNIFAVVLFHHLALDKLGILLLSAESRLHSQ